MERHQLVELTDDVVRYKYFPEGGNEYGIVSVNRKTRKRDIEQPASNYPMSYAFHACRAIERYIDEGNFPAKGMSAWY